MRRKDVSSQMSITDEEFFTENIVNVNKRVNLILLTFLITPTLFILLTIPGFWVVPYDYSIYLAAFSLFAVIVQYILNRNTKTQILSMYFGILASSICVGIMGCKDVVIISISYCFGPFISCLYYNRKLTNISSLFGYLIMLFSIYLRALQVQETNENFDFINWYATRAIGATIEFAFVFFISDYMSRRTNRTLHKLMTSVDELDNTFSKLKERNQYIIRINNEIEEKNQELNDTQYKIIQFVAQCLGSHDLFTGRHVMHTKRYVEIIAKELRDEGYYLDELTDRNIDLYQTAAFLHDIGKIHIPEGVLNKVGKFTPEEFELMKCHPEEGRKLLEFLPPIEDGKFNEIAKQMAYTHHEKWDGSGYPNHLMGTEIPLSGRIMAAADVLDALISQRLYKEPLSVHEAMDVFRKSSGIHFEPCIAQAVINCKPVIEMIDNDFKTTEATTNAQELEWWQKYHENFRLK